MNRAELKKRIELDLAPLIKGIDQSGGTVLVSEFVNFLFGVKNGLYHQIAFWYSILDLDEQFIINLHRRVYRVLRSYYKELVQLNNSLPDSKEDIDVIIERCADRLVENWKPKTGAGEIDPLKSITPLSRSTFHNGVGISLFYFSPEDEEEIRKISHRSGASNQQKMDAIYERVAEDIIQKLK